MEVGEKKSPERLLRMAVRVMVSGPLGAQGYRSVRSQVPASVEMELYAELWRRGKLCQLGWELSNDLGLLERLLGVWERRQELEQMFQAVFDHGLNIAENVAAAYLQRLSSPSLPQDAGLLKLGFRLGRFLLDSAWFDAAGLIFRNLFALVRRQPATGLCEPGERELRLLELAHRLLEAENGHCQLGRAKKTADDVKALLRAVEGAPGTSKAGRPLELSDVYIQLSQLAFAYSDFDASLGLAVEACRRLTEGSGVRRTVTALRMTGKVLVVKRRMREAGLLMEQAVALAKAELDGARGCPEVLLDYGFYLINEDESEAAAGVQELGLELRRAALGPDALNLRVAQAHEELAYALYVREYSTGSFREARQHSERAIHLLSRILPQSHLLVASAKRVKALILEEMAIDSDDAAHSEALLREAEALHHSALLLSRQLFGEDNLQTAKHFGNLGRLFQSMKRLDEAEAMHRRAIQIKKRLLGESDYEVALSMGHLASLYAYDMERWEEAVQLYQTSIRIGRELLGDAYSGLEYDYRGLIHSYAALDDQHNVAAYTAVFHHWSALRQEHLDAHKPQHLFHSLPPPKATLPLLRDFLKAFPLPADPASASAADPSTSASATTALPDPTSSDPEPTSSEETSSSSLPTGDCVDETEEMVEVEIAEEHQSRRTAA